MARLRCPANFPRERPTTHAIESRLAEQLAQRQKQESDALNSLKLPPVTKKAAVLTKHISEQAKKDSAGMAHVLRAWMAESGDEGKQSERGSSRIKRSGVVQR